MTWVNSHGQLALLIAFVYSVLTSSMPQPGPTDKRWYVWLYHGLHIAAADWSRIFGAWTPKP